MTYQMPMKDGKVDMAVVLAFLQLIGDDVTKVDYDNAISALKALVSHAKAEERGRCLSVVNGAEGFLGDNGSPDAYFAIEMIACGIEENEEKPNDQANQ